MQYIQYKHFSSNRPPEQPQQKRSENNRWSVVNLASIGMGASLLFGKTKYLLVALKLTKATPLISMVLSSFAYSFIFGWPYAVGMVGLIFVHECGHALVMRHYGVPFSPMVFIPFMGAVISMKDQPRTAYEEAMIAFGGPALGSAAAVAISAAGAASDSQLLLALADFGFMINLFNLLPVGSLDGGRIGNAISPWFGAVGLAGGGFLIYNGVIHNPIFYFIMLGGAYDTTMRLMGWSDSSSSEEEKQQQQSYYRIPRQQQAQILSGYVALIGALLLAMEANNANRRTPRQLQQQQQLLQEENSSAVVDLWRSSISESRSDKKQQPQQQNRNDGVYDDYSDYIKKMIAADESSSKE